MEKVGGVLFLAVAILAFVAFTMMSPTVLGRPKLIECPAAEYDHGYNGDCGSGSHGGTHVPPEPTVKCCFEGVWDGPGGSCTLMQTAEQCHYLGGAVQDCIPHDTYYEAPTGSNTNLTEEKNLTGGYYQNLTAAVTRSGIAGRTYGPAYDCDDFSDDLEKNLTAQGYDATFTQYVKYKADGSIDYAHAVVDVHVPGGKMVWIEPQTGKYVSLDFDGDGKVTAKYEEDYKKGHTPTEDEAKIYVYGSAASAAAHGAPRD